MKLLTIILPGAAFAAAAGVSAQPPQAPTSIEAVMKCRAESREKERLQCFDAAATALSQALAARSIIVMDQEAVKNTRRTLFGFEVGKLPFFGGNGSEPEAKEIVAKLRSVRPAGFKMWLLELENGAYWETTEPTDATLPRAGDQITIRKSAGGGYMLHSGARLVRARRLR